MKTITSLLLLLILTTQVGALSIGQISMERAAQEAEMIFHVRVLEGRAHFFDEAPTGRIEPCGGVYTAQVLENIKGEATEIEFGINFNMMLTPGSEYILFLDNRGGLGIESVMFEEKDYRSCTKSFPTKMARWRSSSEVSYELDSAQKMRPFVSPPYGIALPEEFYIERHGYFDEYVGIPFAKYSNYVRSFFDEE